MNISELSIRRPVLSTVLTIIILLFGFIGYSYLGVREFPSVDNPIISVTCSYPGANADVIENQITEPLEQNINGIPGIRSMSSVSSQGQSRITVEFELSVDLETAANDVRDKVSRAQRYLPRDCDPPTVTKADADATPILMVTIQSDKRSLLELSEIADLTVKEQLQTISDVSGVQIWGEKRYSMRLWLDPAKMAGYGITPTDIKTALDRENVELPSGSIEGNTTELTIRTMGLMHTTREFNDLVVREDADRIIRMSDVGRAELGPQDTRSYMKMNGIPMVGVVVIPQPGANHIEIADAVYARMESMKKDLPDDVVTSYGFDNTRFIRASIDEVRTTVYEAFILVIIIITAVLNLFYTPGAGEPLAAFWIFKIYPEGIWAAVYMILRIAMLIACTFLLTYTTSPILLTDGLEKLMGPLKTLHVPVHELSMMMSIALRFIPILVEETDKIMKAQMARGADFETGNIIRKAKAMVPLLVPLFISAFRRATDLAMAMEARCYQGGEGRTKMKPLQYSQRDHDAYMIFALYFVVMIASRVYL